MKATILSVAAVILSGVAGSQAQAQYFNYAPPRPQAPDMCGPGSYCVNPYGMAYGPNYNVMPWFQPYNGERPRCGNGGGGGGPALGPAGFPTHPYARGPRDFFMMD